MGICYCSKYAYETDSLSPSLSFVLSFFHQWLLIFLSWPQAFPVYTHRFWTFLLQKTQWHHVYLSFLFHFRATVIPFKIISYFLLIILQVSWLFRGEGWVGISISNRCRSYLELWVSNCVKIICTRLPCLLFFCTSKSEFERLMEKNLAT